MIIWHIFEFLLLFAINGIMLWFFGGYLNLLIAVMMLLLLLYSIISVHVAIPYLSVEILMPTGYVEKNTPFHVKVQLKNRCVLPFVRARIKLLAGNSFYDSLAEQDVTVSVKPFGVTETILPFRSEFAGYIEIQAIRLTLFDFLSVHPVKKDIAADGSIGILPKPDWAEDYPLNDFSVGMKEAVESRMTGSDFSDVSQVREYIPGDSMKDIHWKLSAKRDDLMVKERLRMSSKKMMVVLSLMPGDAGKTDAALDKLYGLGLYYLKNRVPVSICFYSRRFHEIREETAESKDEWRDAVLRILFSQAGDGDVETAFRNLYPEQGYLLFDESGVTESINI